MKFIVNSATFSKALKVVSPAIQQSVVMPILETVLVDTNMGNGSITATNLNLTITQHFVCESEDVFRMLLPFKYVSNLSSVLGDMPITIEDGDTQVMISADKKYKLPKSDDASVFPNTEAFEPDFEFDADEELMYHLQLATNCASTSPNEAIFRNICLEFGNDTVTVLASNRSELFRYRQKLKTREARTVRVDHSFIKALKSIGSGKISVNEKFLSAESSGIKIVMKQSEQQFANCDVFFTEYEHNASIGIKPVLSALNALMIFGKLFYTCVLHFSKDSVKITFDDETFGEHFESEDIACDHDIESGIVKVSAAAFKNILSLIPESENIKMCVGSERDPIHVDPDTGNGLQFVLAPLYIQE